MSDLTEEVSVSITSPVKTVSLQNLGMQLIIGPSVMCGGRTVSVPVSTGADPAANAIPYLGATGSPTTSGNNTVEYAKALAAFSQSTSPNGAPSTVKLGAMGGAASATATIVDNAETFTSGSISAYVNGTLVTTPWASSKAATLAALAAAMQVALRAQTSGDSSSTVTYTDDTHTILVAPESGVSVFVAFIIAAGATDTLAIKSIVYSAPESYADALNNILLADSNFYQVTIASVVTADIIAVSAVVNAPSQPMVFFYKSGGCQHAQSHARCGFRPHDKPGPWRPRFLPQRPDEQRLSSLASVNILIPTSRDTLRDSSPGRITWPSRSPTAA